MIKSQYTSGEYSEEDEMIIKSRSIRKEDNPEHYKERLLDLESADFANAVYAYSVRSKTNERNSIKLKELAMKLKKPIWLIQSVDVSSKLEDIFLFLLTSTCRELVWLEHHFSIQLKQVKRNVKFN